MGELRVFPFFPNTQTALFFLHFFITLFSSRFRCYYHYHSCELNTVPADKQTEAEAKHRHDETKANAIKQAGFQYTVVWQCQWEAMIRSNPDLQEFLESDEYLGEVEQDVECHSCFDSHQGPIDEALVLSKIKSGAFFGFAVCDVRIPEELIPKYDRYPLIIKDFKMSRKNLTPDQLQEALEHDLLRHETRTVIGSTHAEQYLATSDMIQYWLEEGLLVSNITTLCEYQRKQPWKSTIDRLVQLRRDGDKDKDGQLIAQTSKIILNSIYGRCLLRKVLALVM